MFDSETSPPEGVGEGLGVGLPESSRPFTPAASLGRRELALSGARGGARTKGKVANEHGLREGGSSPLGEVL